LLELAAFNCVFHILFLGLLSGWEGCPGLAGADSLFYLDHYPLVQALDVVPTGKD
jgi:hypothetical protein